MTFSLGSSADRLSNTAPRRLTPLIKQQWQIIGERKRLPITNFGRIYTELFRAQAFEGTIADRQTTNRQTSLMQQWPIRETGISRDRPQRIGNNGLPGHILRGQNKVCGTEEGFRKRERDSIGFGSRSAAVERGRADSRTILGRRGLSWPVRVVSVPRSVVSFPVVRPVLSRIATTDTDFATFHTESSSLFLGIFLFTSNGVIYNKNSLRAR